MNTDYLERIGEWPYGSALSAAVDSTRDIIFLGSGGAVLMLDGSDINNPLLISDTIRTAGLVLDIFYDVSTHRLYLACGEGGYEIWNVEDPSIPFRYSRNEISYGGAEPPVEHIQVRGDYAVLACSWGEINSVNVSDPYNPYQVSSDDYVGNPAHNVYIDPGGYVHATGNNNYVVYYLDAGGLLQRTGAFPITCDAIYARTGISYVGSGNRLFIFSSGFSYSIVGAVNDIEVRGNIAYILNDDGLDVWDVSDINNLVQLSSTPIDIFPKDLYVAGNFAYVANDSHGLKIYDVRNPSSPLLAGSYETYSVAIEAYIKDSIAYVTHYDDGLLMIDISNREYPLLIGQYLPPGDVEDIEMKENLAILTCYEGGLRIVDVSDPSDPVEISVVPGFNAWVLETSENYAYVEEVYPPDNTANIRIFDISDPYNPTELGSIGLPYYAWSFTYHNGYLYVADYQEGFKIINVTDPQNPYLVNTIQLPDVLDLYIKGDDAYVCAADWPAFNGGLHIYDISDPEVPVEKGYYGAAGFSPMDVAVTDSFAYVATGYDVWLFKLTESDPVFLDQFKFPDIISGIVPVDEYLYAANSKAGLSIHRNNLISSPVPSIWEFQVSGTTRNIWSVYFTDLNNGWAAAEGGKLLHTTDGGNNWEILQVGDPYLDDFMDLTFTDENTGWVCGKNHSMYKTTDGGAAWAQVNVPTTSDIRAMSFLNDTLGWITPLEENIYKTTDGGVSWIQQNNGLTGNLHNINVCFTDADNGFVTGIRIIGMDVESYILRTTNGGQDWTADFSYQNQDTDPIFFINQDTGWIGGSNGFLIKTTDGGETWQYHNAGPVYITSLFFNNEHDGWLTGFDGALYQTIDGGNLWQAHNILVQNLMRSVYFVDEKNGWAVGDNGTIIHTGEGIIPVEITESSASAVPSEYSLEQNFPNPYNPATTIRFSVPEEVRVTLEVYNILGERIKELKNEVMNPGYYDVVFDGRSLVSGIYFYRIEAGGFVQTRKMVLLR